MSCYTHLTTKERECLMLLYEKGESIRKIAKSLHRSPSSISRELKRNESPYRASLARERYCEQRSRCVRSKILDNVELRKTVTFLLGKLYWSPEQVSNRLKMERKIQISTNTIYRALETGLLRDTLRYYLRIKYKKHGKSSKIRRRCFQNTIENRPKEADERSVLGHWEGDTIHSSNEADALVTIADRKSRLLLCAKVPNKESQNVRRAMAVLLHESKLPVLSVTLDQGTEFADNKELEQELQTDVYYAHPRSPWERPTNENTNGLIRQFIPKRKKISQYTDEDVRMIMTMLNFRPRKCLGWLTPYESAFNQVLHLT